MAGKWDRRWWPQGTTNGSWQKYTNSGPGFAYPVVEAHAQNTIKESEQKTLHQSGWLTIISLDQGTYLQTIMSNNGQWDIRPLSTSSMENLNEQWKHWLSKMGGDKAGRSGLHTPSWACAHTQYEHEQDSGMSVLERFLCFSSESGEEEVEKVLIYFLSYITSTFFSLPDQRSKDQGSNYKGWKQRWFLSKILQLYFNPSVRIPKGLMEQDGPLPILAELVQE